MELLENEKNRSLRGNTVFTIAMLDIDHFKKVNDTYGHQAGDEVLRRVSAAIKSTMRNTDFCGRYGGEEFVLVLIQTDLKEAMICGERMRPILKNAGSPASETVSGLPLRSACRNIR
jgi:diguanylate cyclase (GGDEF)-like protein